MCQLTCSTYAGSLLTTRQLATPKGDDLYDELSTGLTAGSLFKNNGNLIIKHDTIIIYSYISISLWLLNIYVFFSVLLLNTCIKCR